MTIDRSLKYILAAPMIVTATWWGVSLAAAAWGGYDTLGVVSLDGDFLQTSEAAVIDKRGVIWVLRETSVSELISGGAVIIFPARAKTCLAIVQATSPL